MTTPADNPVRNVSGDLLGRANAARSFARQVLELDASEGVVVGVLGSWGSGKTSFVNLARPDLEAGASAVIDFNPWMFSGAEQLVQSFFVELGAQLKLKPNLAQIGDDLQDYGETFSGLGWLPFVGTWIERVRGASKVVSTVLQRRRQGVGATRTKLAKALLKLERPIIVVVDDIDRLTTSEIRDIFKLIRLTASFPNLIYIAAFDRKRVEDALAEEGIPGRDYLEKILQVGVDLPAVPESVLSRQVLTAINHAIDGIEPEAPFDETAWPDVYVEVIRPLIRNMRDVRRYAAAVRGTLTELGGQVELVDVLALESVRVFLPDVFHAIQRSLDALTEPAAGYGNSNRGVEERLRGQISALVELAGDHGEVVEAMVRRLFLAANRHLPGGMSYGHDWQRRWLRARRVAHKDVLSLYLERVVGDNLQSFVDAESAWPLMTDRDQLDAYLRSLDRDRLQDVISSLEAYEDEFSEQHSVPAITVLLNLQPDLPDRPRGMFELETRWIVGRVVYRLLRTLPDEASVERVVNEILPQLATLSAQLELVSDVGHREGRGHKLANEQFATQLERNWREAVRGASVEKLIREPELVRILYLTQREAEPEEEQLQIHADPRLTAAILASARSDVRSQSMGSRAVRRSARLAWDVLVELFGSEEVIRARVDELRQTDLTVDEGLLELVDRYLSGWRPDRDED